MPRLFTAIEIPGDVALRLSLLRGRLPGARWITPDHYHLTMRFAGDISELQARDFAAALDEIKFDAFTMALSGLGAFGNRRPRALWVGVAPCEPLMQLQRAHERAARQVGLEPETRNFTPHITLARLRDTPRRAIAAYLTEHGGFTSAPFPVERFLLMSSRASQGGGPYLIEQEYAANGIEQISETAYGAGE